MIVAWLVWGDYASVLHLCSYVSLIRQTKKLKLLSQIMIYGSSKLLPFFVHLDNDITEEEEKIERKVKPKPRSSVKGATTRSPSSTKTKISSNVKASKYFQSPVKEEENDSEDDFDIVAPAEPAFKENAEKMEEDGEDEDSEEDEDDWEEVEG